MDGAVAQLFIMSTASPEKTMIQSQDGREHFRMFVNGEFRDSASGKVIEVAGPTTEEILYSVHDATNPSTNLIAFVGNSTLMVDLRPARTRYLRLFFDSMK